MLLPVVEDWVKGVRSNLLQWSTRLLGQEQWQPYSSGQVSNCLWICDLYDCAVQPLHQLMSMMISITKTWA